MASYPVAAAFSGTADANGNASLQVAGLSPGRYAVWNLSASVKGIGVVMTVLVGAQAQGQGYGNTPQIGPVYTQPNNQVTVTVTGAQPGTAISGQLSGYEGDGLVDLPPLSSPQPTVQPAQTQYQSDSLVALSGASLSTAQVNYGPFPVANWFGVEGFLWNQSGTSGGLLANVISYQDQAQTQVITNKVFVVNSATVAIAHFNFQIGGPWVLISLNLNAAGTAVYSLVAHATQRPAIYPFQGVLPFINSQHAAVAAGASVTDLAPAIYEGPVQFTVRPGGGHGQAQVQQIDDAGVVRTIAFIDANQNTAQQVVYLPAYPVQVVTTNAGAAATSLGISAIPIRS